MKESEETTFSQNAGEKSYQYQAGRDIKIVNNINANLYYNQYLKLVAEFEKELESGEIEFSDFIDKIQHYTSNVDQDEIIGLELKLSEAGFEDDYIWARGLKEYYFKKLTENSLSKATQRIHAFLLARICILFNYKVKGALNDGATKEEAREIIINNIIMPVEEMLGENNVLDLYADDITAMIYFLTGNCHIRWK